MSASSVASMSEVFGAPRYRSNLCRRCGRVNGRHFDGICSRCRRNSAARTLALIDQIRAKLADPDAPPPTGTPREK